MTVTEAVERRRATPVFDAACTIPPDALRALIRKACLAPSALNLQPWRFVICETDDEKARLCEASYGQRKVRDAAAVVAVFGDLEHHLLAEAISDGNAIPDVEERGQWITLANTVYRDPQAARDEAFRGGSLWAMTFTLLATEAGWDTSLVGGFDAEAIRLAFEIPERYLPVLLVAVGRCDAKTGRRPRASRMSLAELTL